MAETKVKHEKDISRYEWECMTSRNPKSLRTPKTEVIAWLKEHGRELSANDATRILQVYFDVQLGDTIITHSNLQRGIPSGAKYVVVTGGNKHRQFVLTDIFQGIYQPFMQIDDEDSYSGSEKSAGIFYFFLHESFYTIREVPHAE